MISYRIAQLRCQMGLTQVELSDKLHLNLKTIRKWENGDSSPSAANIIQLSKLFSVSADYLLGIEDRFFVSLEELPEKDRTRICAMIQVYVNLTKHPHNMSSSWSPQSTGINGK